MPLNKDIKKVLVIGSGPIVIGQAAEFDYAGAQACRVLKQAGVNVVLVNSNPATIMTDKALADEIEEQLDDMGISVSHVEGYRSNSWILLDYIDIIVHVFSNEAREYYDLERLWEDGTDIDISDIID